MKMYRLMSFTAVVAAFGGWFCYSSVKAVQVDPVDSQFFKAIRSNDLSSLANLLKSSDPNAQDKAGMTPLMLAAADGSSKAFQMVLDAGADPNHADSEGVTALMICAGDATKVKAILDKGADVKAQSKAGASALEIAANYDGRSESVRLLIEHGADVNQLDGTGVSPLEVAAGDNCLESAKLLLAHGADPNNVDKGGATPLIDAAGNGPSNSAMVKLLLHHGANPNVATVKDGIKVPTGVIRLGYITPLHVAAQCSYESTKSLVFSGAKVNAKDVRGDTPLVFAVATDHPDLRTIKFLIHRGADVTPASDWVRTYNNPAVAKACGIELDQPDSASSWKPTPPTASKAIYAIKKELAFNQPAAVKFFKKGQCFSCHSQILNGVAVMAARPEGIPANYKGEMGQRAMLTGFLGSQTELQLQDIGTPAGIDGIDMFALHLSDPHKVVAPMAPSITMDSLIHYLLSGQRKDGSWPLNGSVRPPLEDGSFTDTAKSIYVLRAFPIPGIKSETQASINLAVNFLLTAKPVTTEDRSMQILGLAWAGHSVPKAFVRNLVRIQRSDGGWGQTANLPCDAYATGEALWALHMAGEPSRSQTAKSGVRYLLSTQEKDGTWHVATRSLSFQPYFESGFPYSQDQWISQAGSSMAAIALSFMAK